MITEPRDLPEIASPWNAQIKATSTGGTIPQNELAGQHMADISCLYGDQRGEMIDRGDGTYLEIRWHDTTSDMSGEECNRWMTTFTEYLEATPRPSVLFDSMQFRMPMDRMDTGWRDAHIVPRYNAAGRRKFAFLMPEGMPAIGAQPSREGPAAYPTGYVPGEPMPWTGWRQNR